MQAPSSFVVIGSFALALSMLESGWAITDPTKLAIIRAGLEEILPSVSGKSIDIIKGDIALIDDGNLSDNDAKIILDHMWVLTKGEAAATSARGIVAAKIAKAIQDNAADPHGLELVRLEQQKVAKQESPKERSLRLERERMAKISARALSNKFWDDKSWKTSTGNTMSVKIGWNWGTISIQGDEKDDDVTHLAKVDLTTVLATGKYDMTITISEWWPLNLYLYDARGNSIDMDWFILPMDWKKSVAQFTSGKKETIVIPENCRSCMFQGIVTPQNRKIVIDSFSAEQRVEIAQK